jgi:hypothetical protein
MHDAPEPPKGMLATIQLCCGMSDKQMAGLMELRLREYKSIKHLAPPQLADMDLHPMWAQLEHFIDLRVGWLMAARAQLQQKRRQDHKRAVGRRIAALRK